MFAFIRFASLDEASSVASKVNGMHVYGCPISSKLASLDWRNRSFPDYRLYGETIGDGYEGSSGKGVNVSHRGFRQGSFQDDQFFAQVVKRN